MRSFSFADLFVNVKTTSVRTPVDNIFRSSSFHSLYQPHKDTNLVQPGGTPVQGEDVTERGVRRLLH